ncbi:hypothetical protein MMC25_007930 [Agyrium rufum]|nr:hypothetical protein [Agyrium rufum]
MSQAFDTFDAHSDGPEDSSEPGSSHFGAVDKYSRSRIVQAAWKIALEGKLIRVPLAKDRHIRIADAGCGAGAWLVDAAKEYPNATVLGIDRTPSNVGCGVDILPNINFQGYDLLYPWLSGTWGRVDFIHQRHVQCSMEEQKTFVQNYWQAMRPGGYVQIVNSDDSLQLTYDLLLSAGFTDVKVEEFSIVGPTYVKTKALCDDPNFDPSKVGVLRILDSFVLIGRKGKEDDDEVESFPQWVENHKQQMNTPEMKDSWWRVWICYGRKPQ